MATIIAEVGQNFMGDMALAKKLIRLAKENGADLVKFQLYEHKKLYGDNPNIPNVELSFDQAKMLFDYGKEIGIEVFFSVFDTERVKWCEEIGVRRYKIATLRKDAKVIDAVLQTQKPVYISMPNFTPPLKYKSCISYLYCVPEYPASVKKFHKIHWNEYDGFSDHTIGLDVAQIALSRGAQIIEKHFAIDHKTGVDAEWSMTPDELKELVRFKRVIEQAL